MKIDLNKLYTISNFSKKIGITRQGVWRQVRAGEWNTIEISGVKFIKL